MSEDDLDAQERRDFRAWVRTHHPDAGGDAEAFVAGLTAWRRRRNAGPAGPMDRPRVTAFRSRHGMWTLARWWRRRRGTPRVH